MLHIYLILLLYLLHFVVFQNFSLSLQLGEAVVQFFFLLLSGSIEIDYEELPVE